MATNSGVSATTRGLVGVWARMQQYSVNKSTTGRPKGGRHLYCTHDCLWILITMMLTCCVGYLPSWKGVEGIVSNRYLISVSSVWTVCRVHRPSNLEPSRMHWFMHMSSSRISVNRWDVLTNRPCSINQVKRRLRVVSPEWPVELQPPPAGAGTRMAGQQILHLHLFLNQSVHQHSFTCQLI